MSAIKNYMEEKSAVIAKALGIKEDVVHAVIFSEDFDIEIYAEDSETESEHTKKLCRAVAHEIYKYQMLELAAKVRYNYTPEFLWDRFYEICDDAIDGESYGALFKYFSEITMEYEWIPISREKGKESYAIIRNPD